MNNDQTNEDPATIERDIRRTQDDMSRTVDKIGDQLSIRNIFNALLDKADENDVDARMVIDGARRNPIALGLIAAGAIWLVSDKDSKIPSMGKSKWKSDDQLDLGGHDIHHRDYVSHMSSVEMRDGEDPNAYQQRRDSARASFLMCERKPQEEESSFRQRLDELTDKFRDKRQAWSDSAADAGQSAKQSVGSAVDSTQQMVGSAVDKTQDLYSGNPLVGGILAAALGAAVGSAFPTTRTEKQKLGSLGEKARDMASETKDDLVAQADDKLKQAEGSSGSPDQRSRPESSQKPQQDAPFIIGEPAR
jgi:uncharacterized protein DUF3618